MDEDGKKQNKTIPKTILYFYIYNVDFFSLYNLTTFFDINFDVQAN